MNTLSEYTLLHTLLLLVSEIVKSLQCILNYPDVAIYCQAGHIYIYILFPVAHLCFKSLILQVRPELSDLMNSKSNIFVFSPAIYNHATI